MEYILDDKVKEKHGRLQCDGCDGLFENLYIQKNGLCLCNMCLAHKTVGLNMHRFQRKGVISVSVKNDKKLWLCSCGITNSIKFSDCLGCGKVRNVKGGDLPMTKKEKATVIEKRVADIRSAEKGKGGILPGHKKTEKIKCIVCGAIRMVAKSDVWQVKRCVKCQKAYTLEKRNKFIAKKRKEAGKVVKPVIKKKK